MTENTRNILKKADDIFSYVLLAAMTVLLIFSVMSVVSARKTGEVASVFGYRPIMVQTGSMEPYIMTNGLALTKIVNSVEELEEGDVISYHVAEDDGHVIRITHRIVSIEDGIITTKGDNNNVTDAYPLTIENVESKVIAVFNQSAWLIATWQTTSGKILIWSVIAGTLLLYFSVKSYLRACREEKKTPSQHFEA